MNDETVKAKVLFADDEPNILYMYKGAFRIMPDVHVTTTESPEEAIELITDAEKQGEPFTHVVSDGFDGKWPGVIEAAKQHGVTKRFVVSASENEGKVTEADARYAHKPISIIDIRELITGESAQNASKEQSSSHISNPSERL